MFTVFDEHPNEFREKQWFMVVVSDLVQYNNNEISSTALLLLSMLLQLLDSPNHNAIRVVATCKARSKASQQNTRSSSDILF